MQAIPVFQEHANVVDISQYFGQGSENLDSLRVHWEICKHDEERAKAQRLEVEERILKCLAKDGTELKESGTNRFGPLKITTGLNRKWDQVKLNEIHANWASKPWPFEAQWKEKTHALKTLEEEDAYACAVIRDALTLEPKKPTFSIDR